MKLDFLKSISESAYKKAADMNIELLPDGRYDLSDGIYVNIESYFTKYRKDAPYESHISYIDVQYILSGKEIITTAPVDKCQAISEYDNDRDIIFYKNNFEGADNVLTSGEFLTILTNEAHMPCICVGKPSSVKKAVFKIPVLLIKDNNSVTEEFSAVEKRKSKIKILVMDVDGTLTDGKIYIGNSGELFKAFNIKDGCGINDILIPHGIEPIIITGRISETVEYRCRELGIKKLYQGVKDKLSELNKFISVNGLTYSDVSYIGDDINDISCMKKIKESGGLTGCPADAAETVKDTADYISSKCGGSGAVRDFIEWLVK